MKRTFKFFLKHYLKLFTRITLFIHKPKIIAIAGSTNKNFVKKEIKRRLLEKGFTVRANPKNFNTEIGLPLAVLNLSSGYNEYSKWIPTLAKAPFTMFEKNFPDFLILTLGTSDEGDMNYLLSIFKPHISIVTDITQRYREGFNEMNDLVREYETLINRTEKRGAVILNCDNYRVKELGKNTPIKKIFFGFSDDADIKIESLKKSKTGQNLIIKRDGSYENFEMKRFGRHHAYAFASAFALDKEFL